MRYVKQFETSAQFNNFVLDSTNTPNVSLVEELISDNGGLVFTPYIATIPVTPQNISNGHEYIEIAGMKWATMNLGANNITDGGLYYQWGETTGYTAAQVGIDKNFEFWDNVYYDNSSYTKYNATDELP